MKSLRALGAMIAALTLGFGAQAQDSHERAFFPEDADAAAIIDAALAQARDQGKQALIVFGGDWCHDSVALAEALEENDRLSRLVSEHYVLARVDVGQRHRNQDQLQRFGLDASYGTPTLVIAQANGRAENGLTAHDWRTAYNAAPSDIAAYLSRYAGAGWDGSSVASVDLSAVASGWSSYQNALQTLNRQIEAGELTAEEAARRNAFITGMARSITRYGAGQEAEARGVAIADLADLEALGVTPTQDLTDAVIAQVGEIEFDLIARFEAQTRETLEATRRDEDAAASMEP